MDTQQLAALLQESQVPDTQRIKAITAELQKNYYSRPESLLSLIEILSKHDDANIRQQAAVQAARLVPKHWVKLPDEQKPVVRTHLVETAMKEQNAKCRHAASRVIANIADIDFNDGEWPELLPALFNLAGNTDVSQREVGSYIIFSLLEANPTHFSDNVQRLLTLFSQTIRDPQSRDVRVNTMMSIGAMLMLIEPEEDKEGVDILHTIIPSMVEVLKDAVENEDGDRTRQAFEVFQQFLAYESVLLAKHLKDLVQFMIDLAANSQADDDVRSQALSFLAQTVRYRRLKIQGMRDMGSQLTLKSMLILSEMEDGDEDDETTPARSALTLLDQLASDLPPRQVIVPLLDAFPGYAASAEPGYRKAGILALGTCAEGAPDFIASQLKSVMPDVIRLLNDPDKIVRHVALVGLTRLAEDMAEELAYEHEALMTALSKNLQAAMADDADPKTQKKNIEIIRSVLGAIDALSDGFESEIMKKYATDLIPPITGLLGHGDFKLKSSAASAIGAISVSLAEDFKPYFEQSMGVLGQYVMIKDSEEELNLRSAVCDAMGRIAAAVGPEMFQPYVLDLMRASEEALNLDNSRLRETSFILWSALAKVYEAKFSGFLPGVFKGLLESLELEEEEVVLDLNEEEQAIVGDSDEIVVGGKKIKIRSSEDADDSAMEDDDDDDDDSDDFGVSPQALEKEIAIEVLGDVIAYACGPEQVTTYLERAIEQVTPLTEHSYEGCRKAAISMLWRSYARVWQLMEEETGSTWEPGFPIKSKPTTTLVKLGEIVSKATLALWLEESERSVVTEINRSVAATLKACGPAILDQEEMITQIITVLGSIITRSHICQQDLGDEDEPEIVEGSSEYDWLVIDTALDVIIALATSLGKTFGELWKVFEKPITKMGSSSEATERSTAIGVIAECAANMGDSVSPYTASLLKLLIHRLTDEDPETRSNAAYATGQLILSSTDSKTYLPQYNTIMSKLEPMLQTREYRILDNAAGCVCRMIIAHPDRVPLGDVLPALVNILPLTQDFEENKPVYECIMKLYQQGEPTIMQLTPKLIPIFEQVLSPPDEQLEEDSKVFVKQTVHFLYGQHPELFQNHQDLLRLAA